MTKKGEKGSHAWQAGLPRQHESSSSVVVPHHGSDDVTHVVGIGVVRCQKTEILDRRAVTRESGIVTDDLTLWGDLKAGERAGSVGPLFCSSQTACMQPAWK